MTAFYLWDLYSMSTESSPIHGVKFRGRLRKYCLRQERNVLVENASDIDNVVRFAVPSGENIVDIVEFLKGIVVDVSVTLEEKELKNPVLSKLKVNIESRYTI